MTRIEKAAEKLVEKLELIHKHPAYTAVWVCAQTHQGGYLGPTYEDELAELKKEINATKLKPLNLIIAESQHMGEYFRDKYGLLSCEVITTSNQIRGRAASTGIIYLLDSDKHEVCKQAQACYQEQPLIHFYDGRGNEIILHKKNGEPV
jgi:hypothetical protein